jgi:hypothetical protein
LKRILEDIIVTTATVKQREVSVGKERVEDVVATGRAAAALVAGGVGVLAIGLLTTLAEVSAGLKTFLTWSTPVGPLPGKTGLGVIIWLISWAAFHSLWKDKNSDLAQAFKIALVLIALGLVFTFPPVFEAFAAE